MSGSSLYIHPQPGDEVAKWAEAASGGAAVEASVRSFTLVGAQVEEEGGVEPVGSGRSGRSPGGPGFIHLELAIGTDTFRETASSISQGSGRSTISFFRSADYRFTLVAAQGSPQSRYALRPASPAQCHERPSTSSFLTSFL